MHKDVLTKEQLKLLPLLKDFSADFSLAGGTAAALQIGHRESIDFDLFSSKEFDNFKLRNKIVKKHKIEFVYVDHKGEFTVSVNGVKLTFLHYPFKVKFSKRLDDIIKMADLETLAALKAYALGRRAKWKDYVDLYFILNFWAPIDKVVKKTAEIFGPEFNEKNFRSQLAYFKDIDYSEKVMYLKGKEVSDEKIKKSLKEISLI